MSLINQQYIDLFSHCDENCLILTANQRLGRFITQQYNEYRQTQLHAASHAVWPSLACLSINTWIEREWRHVQSRALHPSAGKLLISNLQEQRLWQDVINIFRQGNEGCISSELSTDSLAQLSAKAWHMLGQWNLTWRDLPEYVDDMDYLKQWSQTYERGLIEGQWLDLEAIINALLETIEQQALELPSQVYCMGFDHQTPLIERLFSCMKSMCKLEFFDIPIEAEVRRCAVNDVQQEIHLAACWAEQQAKQGKRVGVVFPSLAVNRNTIEQQFNRVFHPHSWNPNESRHASGFNISAAQVLTETPLVNAALEVLSFNLGEIDCHCLRRVFHSAFIGLESELIQRSLFCAQLAEDCESISLLRLRSGLAQFNQSCDERDCPDKAIEYGYKNLDAFISLLNSSKKMQLPSQWMRLFEQQLICMGWPGERELDTMEFQQLQLWPQVIENMVQLDAVGQTMTLAEALQYLRRCTDIPFQAQTKASSVQVLGLLEAAGLQFDALWVAQMTGTSWPEPIQPHPLIPTQWQCQRLMPRSSVEKELDYAQALTRRLSHSASDVIFSWAQWSGEEPLTPSPLIECYDQRPVADFVHDPNLRREIIVNSKTDLDERVDEWAVPVSRLDNIRGGAHILKNQAACPFRAFAIHRLAARSFDTVSFGVSPQDHGLLIHCAMEIIWRDLKHSSVLCNLSEDDLSSAVQLAIEQAWTQSIKQSYGLRLKSIEQQRCAAIIMSWMVVEKSRESFTVIDCEKDFSLTLAGLPLRIRIDRIDLLDDQKTLAVIDYKTGDVTTKRWQGDRPDEPQVPLYTLAQPETGAAVYASLKKGNAMGFIGIAQNAELFSMLTDVSELNESFPRNWSELVSQWRNNLEDLAGDFMRGHAAVDPKDPRYTCQYCELRSLCRIREHIELA